jgi:superfamily II DNA or RNA helicase
MDKLLKVSRLLNEPIEDQRSTGEPISSPFVLNPTFKFRDHQIIPSAQLLSHCEANNYGVLSAGCGNGKTVVMTWVAGQLGGKTLILVDMGSLQAQWAREFKMVWGRDIQIIDKNTVEFEDVAVCTFQLLNSNPHIVANMHKAFRTLLLDEFHAACSESRREILFKLSNKFRIGCTATLMKKGFSDDTLTDFVSGISAVMEDKNALKAQVHFVETGRPWYSSDPEMWGKIVSKLSKDNIRNDHTAALTIAMATAGRKVLVIGATIESLQYVNALVTKDPFCKSTLYVGSTTLKQDLALRDDLASGKINIILTSRKADKGLDLPDLDCLILAKPMNNEAGVTQISGRIVRSVEGKPLPLIFDMVDKNSLAERFASNRKKWYRKLNYIVKEN